MVYLIDKEYDVAVFGQFVEYGFDALLELAPVFGACHHSRHVESDHAFVEKHAADLALVYPEREAFDNG